MKLSVFDPGWRINGIPDPQLVRFSETITHVADYSGYERIWFGTMYDDFHVYTCPDILMTTCCQVAKQIRVGIGGLMAVYHDPYELINRFTTISAFSNVKLDIAFGASEFPEVPYEKRTSSYFDVLDQYRFFAQSEEFRNTQGILPEVYICAIRPGMSAEYAAKNGLPFAVSSLLTSEESDQPRASIQFYKQNYVPSEKYPKPYAILLTRAVVAKTRAEVEFQAGSYAYVVQEIKRTGKKGCNLPMPGNFPRSESLRALVDHMCQTRLFGTPNDVRSRIAALVEHTGADEIMLEHPIADLEAKLNSIRLIGPGA